MTAAHRQILLLFLLIVALGAVAKVARHSDEEEKFMSSYNLYQYQGTAQAYKPNAPHSFSVCRESPSARHRSKVATWPYSRSKSIPVKLKLDIQLWSCRSRESSTDTCQKVLDDSNRQHNITLEIWQTRPDGTYSSLTKDDNDCRASFAPDFSDGSSFIVLETYAPGSTGCLAGLGPRGWDFPPYGPPVIHFLILDHSNSHLPLLVNVPISFNRKTLEYSNPFGFWNDWRGSAWVAPRDRRRRASFDIRSWDPSAKSSAITVGLDFYLIQNNSNKGKHTPTNRWLCPSWTFSPRSFFLEPISVCSPWLLDFFGI